MEVKELQNREQIMSNSEDIFKESNMILTTLENSWNKLFDWVNKNFTFELLYGHLELGHLKNVSPHSANLSIDKWIG